MRRQPLDSRVLARVGVLLLRALLPRVLGLAALGVLVGTVLAAGRVLPVAEPIAPTGRVALGLDAGSGRAGPAPSAGDTTPSGATPSRGTGPADPATGPADPATGPGAAPAVISDAASSTAPDPVSSGRRQLPRGGTSVFPRYRLVGFSGGPGSAAFGRLGIGDLDDRADEIERIAARYAAGREPLPVLELVAVIAQPRPGADGRYRVRVDGTVIRAYLDAARRHRALLLLNLQPGRADFLDEVKALEPWLREPDVGLALDPEWAVGPDQVPGRVLGGTTGRELDRVAGYLADLVLANRLPEKVIVVHQLAPQVLRDQAALHPRPGVVLVKSADGIGTRQAKISAWQRMVAGMPPGLHPGLKLFYVEDTAAGPLMTPAQVLALDPQPEYVLYE